MFLWVKLIVFTLKDLHFESDIQDAMNTLPEDLEAMYATPGQPGIRAPLITIQLREDHVAHMPRCEVPKPTHCRQNLAVGLCCAAALEKIRA